MLPLLIVGCQSQQKEKKEEKKEAKSVYIKNYTYPELSKEAAENIRNWYELKTIYQILLSISPERQAVSILQNTNPDSLYVYKRLYPNTNENIHINGNIQQDWGIIESPSDTIYKFVKQKAEESALFAWQEILLKDIPYTFSLRVRPSSGIKHIQLEITRQKDKKAIREQALRLDSLSLNTLEPYTKVTPLEDGWV